MICKICFLINLTIYKLNYLATLQFNGFDGFIIIIHIIFLGYAINEEVFCKVTA